MDKSTSIPIAVFGVVGIALLGGAGYLSYAELQYRREAVRVEGTVIDLVTTSGRKGGVSYKPQVEYVDRQGETHRVTGSVSSNPPGFERGETVEVFYRSENPDDAHIGGFMQTWFGPLLLGGMGLIFGGVALGFALYIR